MEFGKWELRDDSSYYFSKDANIFPSSNALDEGKLVLEENLRNIYRDLTKKNFVTKYNYFALTVTPSRKGIIVSPGEAVIQGYHLYARNSIEVSVPTTNVSAIVPYSLGICLSFDAANHVLGDVVNREAPIGESEQLSGVYLKWFDECEVECNYDNILILGRAWIKDGAIVSDGEIYTDPISGDVREIYHGFETDPFKDHRYTADVMEVQIHGHKTTIYDSIRTNLTDIHNSIFSYDTMHYPIDLTYSTRSKPPTFVTDLQEYINYLPDWYTSKYGDYMTGALRFNNLSIDARRKIIGSRDNPYEKDSVDNEFADSAFISPRTYGNLIRNDNDNSYNYDVGGTIMSIVPGTYNNGTDYCEGYTGIHSALVSQKYGETGLKIHTGNGNESSKYGYTRLVHYNKRDTQAYNDNQYDNVSNFIIENVSKDNRKASIDFKDGEVFFDTYNNPDIDHNNWFKDNLVDYNGIHRGSGFQFYASGENEKTNIDFRIDYNHISFKQHIESLHRTDEQPLSFTGQIDDKVHMAMGLGASYQNRGSSENYSDPYFRLGNLEIKSVDLSNGGENKYGSNYKQNVIEVYNPHDLPYIQIRPNVYSNKYVSEESVQVGTHESNDIYENNAEENTLNRIIIKRVNAKKDNVDESYTYLEQDFRSAIDISKVYNKWLPPIGNSNLPKTEELTPNYSEISGMFSAGNIGCSNKLINPQRTNSVFEDTNNPYTDNSEWVRFTRFGYYNDKDQVNGGPYTGEHQKEYGRRWGDTYNLEFNTNVANRRANQIIWRFKGSNGIQNENSLQYTPPVVLSYIHDNTHEDSGTPTKYTNNSINKGYDGGKGTFEGYIDHIGVEHFNPTNKIRDFLLLENAGLSVSGDINNPSLSGDTLNTSNHLGVTIIHGRVYNAVYNDFAETYEKDNKEEIAKPGDLITLNPETGKYYICDKFEDNLVVGVQSNTYAFLAGGNRIDSTQDIIDLEDEYFTVGLCGKVWVNVIENSYIKPGDLITSSNVKGKACKSEYKTQGTIIGKSLSKPKYFDSQNEYKILMQIMMI